MKPFFRIRIAHYGLSRTPQGEPVIVLGHRTVAPQIAELSGTVPIDIDFKSFSATTLREALEGTMGVAEIEAEPGGLFAVRMQWTPDAVEALTEDRYRFLAPAFQVDGMRRAQRVVGLALTNTATDGWPTIAELLKLYPGVAPPQQRPRASRQIKRRADTLSGSGKAKRG